MLDKKDVFNNEEIKEFKIKDESEFKVRLRGYVILAVLLLYAYFNYRIGKIEKMAVPLTMAFFLFMLIITRKSSAQQYIAEQNILKEFVKKIDNKYQKIGLNSNENITEIRNDLSRLLKYDTKLGNNDVIDEYYNKFGETLYLNKYIINQKETYLTCMEGIIKLGLSTKAGTAYYVITMLRKTNINGRLHIDSLCKYDYSDDVSYSRDVKDKKMYVAVYDSKYFKNIGHILSEGFYKRLFKVNNSELIDLDDITIKKIVDVYDKYRIPFQIVIKDNCLRINIFCRNLKHINEINLFLYNLEMCNQELIEILEDLEHRI